MKKIAKGIGIIVLLISSVTGCSNHANSIHIHQLGDKHSEVKGNCLTKGTLEYYSCADPACSVILDKNGNELFSVEGTFGPHIDSMTTWKITAATHEEIYGCCGKIITAEAEHNYGDFVSNNDATMYSDGTKSRTCNVCSYVETVADAGTMIPKPRDGCFIKIASTKTVVINKETFIPYVSSSKVYARDTFEFEIITNNDNLNVITKVDSTGYTVKCSSAGTITYRICDTSANYSSDVGTITFTGNLNYSPSVLLVGTWYCSNGSLCRYLEFNSNGSGKAYYSSPSNYSSFSWSITGNNLVMRGGVNNTSGFSVDLDTLYIANLCGVCDLYYSKEL